MNERIKELGEQAAVFAEVAWAKQTQATWETNKDIHTIYDEKFAELLIKDCISVIEAKMPEFNCKEEYDNLIRKAGRLDAIEEIKEHFGIES